MTSDSIYTDWYWFNANIASYGKTDSAVEKYELLRRAAHNYLQYVLRRHEVDLVQVHTPYLMDYCKEYSVPINKVMVYAIELLYSCGSNHVDILDKVWDIFTKDNDIEPGPSVAVTLQECGVKTWTEFYVENSNDEYLSRIALEDLRRV